jgi:hypothetical protein
MGFLRGAPDPDAALEHLVQRDHGERGEATPGAPRGESHRKGRYVVTWSTGHSWAALHVVVPDET